MNLTLPLSPPDSIAIANSGFSIQISEHQISYFFNLQLFDCHPLNDKRDLLMRIGRLNVISRIPQPQLVEAFGVSRSTVQRAAKKFREHGEKGFYKPRQGRSRTVINEHTAKRADQLLAEGLSGTKVAIQLGIAKSTFSENRRAGVIGRDIKTHNNPALGSTTDRSQRDRRDRQAPMGRAASDVEGRVLACQGLMSEVEPRFEESKTGVRFGGVLVVLPMLLKEGLVSVANRLLQLPKGYYGLTSILLLLAFMTMARVRNPESLRYHAPGEWGSILGLDRCPETKTLRRKIRQIAQSEELMRDWQSALAREWLDEDSELCATLAVDGHVKVYAGRKGRIPKHFVARQKLCLPATASYWVNALGGKPLLCMHQQLDPKMVKALERDIVPQLETLGVLKADAPDLTQPHSGEPALTLVFDREGWSPSCFRRLARRGIACITWHKNFKGVDWPDSDFNTFEVPIHGPAQVRKMSVALAEKKVILLNGFKVRQIRRKMDNGRQMALITTDPYMPMRQVAGALFSRWSQENCFKYMRQEFNLDALPTHDLEALPPDTVVVNPARRKLEKELRKFTTRLGSLRNRAAAKSKKGHDTASLPTQIEALELDMQEHKAQRTQLPTHIRAANLDDDDKLDMIPSRQRLLFDIIRMTAYRAETRMMPALAQMQGKKTNARKLLSAVMTSDADILPDPDNEILRVRLLGLGSDSCDRALEVLIDELNETNTIFPETNLRMVYEIPKFEA